MKKNKKVSLSPVAIPAHQKPDPSMLNMSMESFYQRFFMSDSCFKAEFLSYQPHGVKVSGMSVETFVRSIPTDDIIKAKCGIGKTSVAKMRKRLAKSGIKWK